MGITAKSYCPRCETQVTFECILTPHGMKWQCQGCHAEYPYTLMSRIGKFFCQMPGCSVEVQEGDKHCPACRWLKEQDLRRAS
jgi:hypothetical protein